MTLRPESVKGLLDRLSSAHEREQLELSSLRQELEMMRRKIAESATADPHLATCRPDKPKQPISCGGDPHHEPTPPPRHNPHKLDKSHNSACELRGEWLDKPQALKDVQLEIAVVEGAGVGLEQHAVEDAAADKTISPCRKRMLRMLYMSPGSGRRFFWDILSLLVVGWDVITIPMLVFEPRAEIWFVICNWISQIFWTLDIGASFLTGFYERGSLVMSKSRIATHYFMTWFQFDVPIVLLDWMLLGLGAGDESTASVGKVIKSLRLWRMVRTLRLLRLLKVKRLVEAIQDQIYSEVLNIHYSFVRLLLRILFMFHLVACCWYWIGTNIPDSGPTWVRKEGLQNSSLGDRYTCSLYWSLAQLGVGTVSFEPTNAGERCFAIFVLLLAVMTLSHLIGTITNLMSQVASMRDDQLRQFWLLRRFFSETGISHDLTQRVNRFLAYACKQHRECVKHSDLQILQLLSEPLHAELQYERHAPLLSQHPFFKCLLRDLWRSHSKTMAHAICRKALTDIGLTLGDILFCRGDAARHMYFVVEGEFRYTHGRGETTFIGPGSWVGEPALWLKWCYMGEFEATIESRLVAVDAVQFAGIVSSDQKAWILAQDYAKQFVADLKAAAFKDGISDLTDREAPPGVRPPGDNGVRSL